MRTLFTTAEAAARGVSRSALRWGETQGRWRRVESSVWGDGPEDPAPLDRSRARVIATGGVGGGTLAGVLHGYDGVKLGDDPHVFVAARAATHRTGTTRRDVATSERCRRGGIEVTTPLRTLLDLATVLDDDTWEQALETALRRGEVTVSEVRVAADELRRRRRPGGTRIVGVLDRRGDVPATGSLLETLMVQLIRLVAGVPAPVRQLRIVNEFGEFVARVDLCWPELGLFIELDGQGHKGQPVHDASRETAIVAATGWLVGRFTWAEVVHTPRTTARRLAKLVAQAKARPLPVTR